MRPITVVRSIDAPADVVFDTVADVRNFRKAVPHIVEVEILSDVEVGVGTRFRETRLMKGKKASTELEVTEYVPNERVRIVADSHGTVWDTVFTVAPENGKTTLTMVMEARPHRLLSRLMNVLIRGVVAGAVASDMDAVKRYCEDGAQAE